MSDDNHNHHGNEADPSVAHAHLQADDNDSALGEENDFTSTSSLTSSVFNFRRENGRTYNSYGDRAYVLPNDDLELDRLDLQHHLLRMTYGGLTTCGVETASGIHQVLDLGTGTGIWAIEYGDAHPASIVTGIDVSPVQPSFVPPNVKFEVMDVEHPWTFTQPFDFVFSRMMTAAVTDWRRYFEQIYDNLSPGGYFELQDISFDLTSDDGSLAPDCPIAKWAGYMLEASQKLGAPLDSVESSRALMIDAGFVDVVQTKYLWPINPWPKNPRLKQIGLWTFHNFTSSLSGISVALFTRGLDWSAAELETFLIDVRADMKNTKIHAYWPMYSICARKPT